MGLRLEKADVTALQKLKPGKRFTVSDEYSGACTEAIPENDCGFTLDLHVRIHRDR